jgi:hypothetical protein
LLTIDSGAGWCVELLMPSKRAWLPTTELLLLLLMLMLMLWKI